MSQKLRECYTKKEILLECIVMIYLSVLVPCRPVQSVLKVFTVITSTAHYLLFSHCCNKSFYIGHIQIATANSFYLGFLGIIHLLL